MGRWIRPTLSTKFHIDFDWWNRHDRDLRIYLYQHLCESCRATYRSHRDAEMVDWIDPDTAEVHRVDGLWQALRTHCSKQPEYITKKTPLTGAVFKVFLANGNKPLTPVELSARIGHLPETILRVIGRGPIYNGIRPLPPDK